MRTFLSISRALSFWSISLVLFVLLASCAQQPTPSEPSSSTSPTPSHPTTTATSGSSTTTQPVPATQTTCPAANTGRAAVTATLALGTHQDYIYAYNDTSDSGTTTSYIRKYDLASGTKTDIIHFDNSRISEARISTDDQWILFVRSLGSQNLLQLLRLDGQGLQTLFCQPATDSNETISYVQWSPDQHKVVFMAGHDLSTASVDVLDLTTGTVQADLAAPAPGAHAGYPHSWLDNTHVYLTGFVANATGTAGHDIYILDTTHGAGQSFSSLPQAYHASNFCTEYDSNTDHNKLFIGTCHGTENMPIELAGPGNISSSNTTGGTLQNLYTNSHLAITSVRFISNETLFFTVNNTSGDISNNGLWKVHLDGTNAQKLLGVGAGEMALSSIAPQYNWSSVSHDGTHYAVVVQGPSAQTLKVGGLTDSTGTTVGTSTGLSTIVVAGWSQL